MPLSIEISESLLLGSFQLTASSALAAGLAAYSFIAAKVP
jgi:hypothetical protein